ncbi:GNAT family acetyltransferase [Rhodotorula toruloides]|uniref:GNAT family acetyltransferase n=1 Tax=Rhodotorula toruloides TaxID=5286 RepID=A0A511K878_RHOTO|nr:GNAT family acetyltransferase [Rhodotorula toruloides]
MPFLNAFQPPALLAEDEYHLKTPLDRFDLNCCYPLPGEAALRTDGVKLVPIIPSLHGRELYDLFSRHPEGYQYLPFGLPSTFAGFLTYLETRRREPGTLLFTVYDLGLQFEDGDESEERAERIAGIVGILKSMLDNRMTEIGHLHIAAPFQRTHVLTHAVALLLNWLLNPPSSAHASLSNSAPLSTPGLGLRRVQWFADARNGPSISAAQRLGFKLETTIMRWDRVLPPFKDGEAIPDCVKGAWRAEEEKRGGGRHSAVLGLGWDDWLEGGGRAKVTALVQDRPVLKRKAKEVKGLLP